MGPIKFLCKCRSDCHSIEVIHAQASLEPVTLDINILLFDLLLII